MPKKPEQARIPKGMVEIVVKGSQHDKGHFWMKGCMPTSFASDICGLLLEKNNKWQKVREEYLKLQKEKRLMRSR